MFRVHTFHAVAASAVRWIGLEIAKSGLSTLVSETVKALLERLIAKQKDQKILGFAITLPDGTVIRCNPDSTCRISR